MRWWHTLIHIRKVTHLVFEKDTETYALQRDAQMIEACKEAGVECIIRSGHTLWEVEEVMKANNNRPTMNQSALLKVQIQITLLN